MPPAWKVGPASCICWGPQGGPDKGYGLGRLQAGHCAKCLAVAGGHMATIGPLELPSSEEHAQVHFPAPRPPAASATFPAYREGNPGHSKGESQGRRRHESGVGEP